VGSLLMAKTVPIRGIFVRHLICACVAALLATERAFAAPIPPDALSPADKCRAVYSGCMLNADLRGFRTIAKTQDVPPAMIACMRSAEEAKQEEENFPLTYAYFVAECLASLDVSEKDKGTLVLAFTKDDYVAAMLARFAEHLRCGNALNKCLDAAAPVAVPQHLVDPK
jgi:hypothetical protein